MRRFDCVLNPARKNIYSFLFMSFVALFALLWAMSYSSTAAIIAGCVYLLIALSFARIVTYAISCYDRMIFLRIVYFGYREVLKEEMAFDDIDKLFLRKQLSCDSSSYDLYFYGKQPGRKLHVYTYNSYERAHRMAMQLVELTGTRYEEQQDKQSIYD
ncbi:MAG: hypothetical protein U0796_14640 [Gemmatales bacterium]